MENRQLETTRLLLRPFTRTDIDALHCHWTDPQVRRYLWDDQIIPREQAAAIVESSLASFAEHGFGFWTVAMKGEPLVIGCAGLRHFDDPRNAQPAVEILYSLAPEHWVQGLASEAARAVLQYGFEVCELPRIFAGADPPNVASFRVMERLGMRFDHRAKLNGVVANYYAITREAHLARQTLQRAPQMAAVLD